MNPKTQIDGAGPGLLSGFFLRICGSKMWVEFSVQGDEILLQLVENQRGVMVAVKLQQRQLEEAVAWRVVQPHQNVHYQ